MFKRFWPCLLIIPPVTLVGGLFVAAVITYVMPKQYESFAVIEIQEIARKTDLLTEVEKLTSATVLGRASEQLDLTARWGIDRPASITRLRDALSIEQLRGTRLVRIRARTFEREEARDIAMAVVQSYQAFRNELRVAEVDARIQALQSAIAEQEQKVAELRAQKLGGGATSPHSEGEVASDLDALHDQETDVLMRMKVDAATMAQPGAGAFLDANLTFIHDAPAMPEAPCSPKVGLNLAIGAAAGLLLGFPMALGMMAVLWRRKPGA